MSLTNGVEVTSWQHWGDLVWGLAQLRDPEFGKFRPYVAFRGQPKEFRNLDTTLQRLGGNLRDKESRLINRLRTYGIDYLRSGDTDWHVAFLGTHYRLPSRLLDWTSSPYVATYFACESAPSEDGEVWCVDRVTVVRDHLKEPYGSILREQKGYTFTLDTLVRRLKPLTELDESGSSPADRTLLFIEPPSMDQRIANQYAFFSMMLDANARTHEWLGGHPGVYRRFVIPARLKTEFLERLAILNISGRTLFPDLDGMCKWLAWYFGK
jgi:hypothetical protein